MIHSIRKIAIIGMMMLLPVIGKAQFLGGFFSQNGTQRKYMIEQISLYATYLNYLKKGYSTARDGLRTVSDIRNGELDLHKMYYNSLSSVSPAIRNQQQVKDAVRYQDEVRKILNAACRSASASNWLQDHEKQYLSRICERLNGELSRLGKELSTVLSFTAYNMTDDERLIRIDGCLNNSISLYGYARTYAADIGTIVANRQRENDEVQISRILFTRP